VQTARQESGFSISAVEMAVFGRELSIWEIPCQKLYNSQWFMKNFESKAMLDIPLSKSERKKMYRKLEKRFEFFKQAVSDIFINALLNHDKKAILGLANADEFFKGKIGLNHEVEPVLMKLLVLKSTFSIHKGKTMREIAEFVYGKGFKPSADGYLPFVGS
jgi:hypothetical protein